MNELTWDDSLSVQVTEVDDDHRKLVDLFNMLNRAVELNDSTEYIDAVLQELVTCTAWHFRHEERLMLKHGYQGLAEHRQEHQELVESAQQLLARFEKDKTLTSQDIEFLEHWLTGHILGADMEMANYLGERM